MLKTVLTVFSLHSTVCPDLKEPKNGKKSCQKVAGKNVCVMTCDKGHSFEAEAITTYGCGPDTEWKWNSQTDLNVPVCLSE